MGKTCQKCGMKSDRDDICTWCNADLKPPLQKAPAGKGAPAPAKGAPPGKSAPAPTVPPRAAPPGAPAAPATAPRGRAKVEVEEEGPSGSPYLIPGLAIAGGFVVLIVALVLIGNAAAGPPAEAGDWKEFTSKDNSFTGSYPSGWGEPSSSGASGSYVLVEWKGAKLCSVKVQGTSKAGSVGDAAAAAERAAAGAMGGGGQLPVDRTADGKLLDFFKSKDWLAQRGGYEESSPQFAYNFANVRAAYTDYTFTKRVGLASIKMKGMRWASQQGDYGYHVTAEAPEKHWDKFKPIADSIVGYIKLGGGAAK